MAADPGSAASYTGAVTLTVIGGLTLNEWAAIVGMTLGVATFGFNMWWKIKYAERRKQTRD